MWICDCIIKAWIYALNDCFSVWVNDEWINSACLILISTVLTYLQLANVLLTDGTAKVADFGYAREIGISIFFISSIENNKSIQVSFCGSPAMLLLIPSLIFSMAPELIENAKCSTKVDVYSFGCVLYEIILEKHCYFDMDLKGVTVVYFLSFYCIVLSACSWGIKTHNCTGNASR